MELFGIPGGQQKKHGIVHPQKTKMEPEKNSISTSFFQGRYVGYVIELQVGKTHVFKMLSMIQNILPAPRKN